MLRARTIADFRHVLVDLALGDAGAADPLAPIRRAFILPTRAAASVFLETVEQRASAAGRASFIAPSLLTREQWLARLHESVPDVPPLLTRFEREVLMERAAHAASARARMGQAPFPIRPGLVTEMVDLYDELHRRQRSVRRFVHVLFQELEAERGTDRGTESLLHQTCFLAFAFLGYERGMAASGAIDEHRLRAQLLGRGAAPPFEHLVVAVADHPSDPRGLWPADFDLLGRLAGSFDLDVVVTDEIHDAGFRVRLEEELPGIEEARAPVVPGDGPVLIRPAGGDTDPLCWIHRDREEELREIARRIRARTSSAGGTLLEPTAIVFQRPLPYVYLAGQVLDEAGIPFQAFDALPLAGEPYAATLDLALDVARTGGTRESVVGLLRSPLLAFEVDGRPLEPEAAGVLDLVLTERRASGGAETYGREVDQFFLSQGRSRLDAAAARRAAVAAAAVAAELAPFREASSGSAQLGALAAFLRAHQRTPPDEVAWRAGYLRARAAVLAILDSLAEACRLHDDRPRTPSALAGWVRHWIERHTFAPLRAHGGVVLVDAIAARFGRFDHVHLVGLVENEWPERPRRNIFYTSGLLKSLGWPQERDHAQVQQAAFRDLIELPARTLSLHAFLLEGDAIVAHSPLVETARRLPPSDASGEPGRAVFPDELLACDPPVAARSGHDGARWLALRVDRPPLTDRRYTGFVGARPPEAYRISRVDRYVDCPFKYFAESVLGLPEEREELSGLSPLERGTLVHTLFESFYREWQATRGGAITAETLPEALDLFGRLTRERIATLPPPDRALEEVRLLGSIVARGMAERVFELEADAGGDIGDRLIEIPLEGTFEFPRLGGFDRRAIAIRGKADRIDVFRNGEVRVVDYKLSRLPDTDASIQIAAYAYAVQRLLEERDGRAHPVVQAMYLAFGDQRQTEGSLAAPGPDTTAAVMTRAAAFAEAIDRIEAGEFPPRPRKPAECFWCKYAGVCRKEYQVPGAPSAREEPEP